MTTVNTHRLPVRDRIKANKYLLKSRYLGYVRQTGDVDRSILKAAAVTLFITITLIPAFILIAIGLGWV